MTAFFVKTEQSFAGPFTGVELREAALAGIVGPDTPVGGGPSGPWMKADEIGLFSEKKLAIPHPPGTHVPQFEVRGMQGGSTGPFKLRELIGFAARGMVPADAMIKSDVTEQWMPLQRLAVLTACLSGELVLLGEDGKVHVRTRSASAGKSATSKQNSETIRPPGQAATSIDITTSISRSHVQTDPDTELLVVGEQGLVIDEQEDSVAESEESAELDQADDAPRRRRPKLPAFRLSLPAFVQPRLIVNALGLLLVIAGIGAAYSYWRNMGMSREVIVGNWIGGGKSGVPAFGISFRKDGSCVIFNSKGESWSGDYAWATHSGDDEGFQDFDPVSSEVDQIDPAHESGPVEPSDGYIRFRGFVDQPPMIGRHRVADCFVRRDGETLRIGYPTTVNWTRSSKSMDAGWISVRPLKLNKEADIIADLQSMPIEERPVKGYSVEKSPHISEAITALRNSQQTDALDGDVDNGSTCYSVKVNAEYLLRMYGIPDEARPPYAFEIPQLSRAQSFAGTQVVRYGALELMVRSDGSLQYVSLML